MKVAFDLRPLEGPFGGGNSFLQIMVTELMRKNIEVKFDLRDSNLDFIFILDPRWSHPMRSFNSNSIYRYLRNNPRTLVIHRINECDERKNTNSINKKLRIVNCLADYTVLVGSWLYELDLFCVDKSIESKKSSIVILNGSDEKVFFPDWGMNWSPNNKLRIVTHHWSSNHMKGSEVYKQLDDLLSFDEFSDFFEFTYIGNLPNKVEFRNTKVIPPIHGAELASELRKHHVYLTGSKNEPGGNHQNEGGLTGLPIIFLNSGCMPEYCSDFGIGMSSSKDLEGALKDMRLHYLSYREKMRKFPNNATNMVANYIKLFDHLNQIRESLLERRGPSRSSWKSCRLRLPL